MLITHKLKVNPNWVIINNSTWFNIKGDAWPKKNIKGDDNNHSLAYFIRHTLYSWVTFKWLSLLNWWDPQEFRTIIKSVFISRYLRLFPRKWVWECIIPTFVSNFKIIFQDIIYFQEYYLLDFPIFHSRGKGWEYSTPMGMFYSHWDRSSFSTMSTPTSLYHMFYILYF